MIHIATVHFKRDLWVDLQLSRLAAKLDRPYRTYACLEGDAVAHAERFDEPVLGVEKVHHWRKLDELGARICAQAEPEDVLLFLDGDAFPIADLGAALDEMLASHPLAAIRRPENNDVFPHPSFCATTCRFWQDNGASWNGGYMVPDIRGELVTDTGANLLKLLEDGQIDWLPLHRTNVRNLHPVMFGVYADLIYHHGAGFRRPLTRVDFIEIEEKARQRAPDGEVTEELRERVTLQYIRRNNQLSKRIYRRVVADEHFWRKLFY
jgi:hypothetical protein